MVSPAPVRTPCNCLPFSLVGKALAAANPRLTASAYPALISPIMPQKRSIVAKKRTTIYLETELFEKFLERHSRFGDFSTVMNDLLRSYLKERESREGLIDDGYYP